MQSPGRSLSPQSRDPSPCPAQGLGAGQGLLERGGTSPAPSELQGGQRDEEQEEPEEQGRKFGAVVAYSGILMKRQVSSSLIYHIM